MKLRDVLKEADFYVPQAEPHSNYHGRNPASFSAYNVGYRPTPGNNVDDKLTQTLDADIEAQLIDRAIDILYDEYPELVKDKKIKRHFLQMLIGKVTSGEIPHQISLENFIKRLWNTKKIKVG